MEVVKVQSMMNSDFTIRVYCFYPSVLICDIFRTYEFGRNALHIVVALCGHKLTQKWHKGGKFPVNKEIKLLGKSSMIGSGLL